MKGMRNIWDDLWLLTLVGNYLNVGRMKVSYSNVVASWTMASAGWSTAANTSAALISCCKHGQTCCHHSFYKRSEMRWKNQTYVYTESSTIHTSTQSFSTSNGWNFWTLSLKLSSCFARFFVFKMKAYHNQTFYIYIYISLQHLPSWSLTSFNLNLADIQISKIEKHFHAYGGSYIEIVTSSTDELLRILLSALMKHCG